MVLLVLHVPVLEPDFDVVLAVVQQVGHLQSRGPRRLHGSGTRCPAPPTARSWDSLELLSSSPPPPPPAGCKGQGWEGEKSKRITGGRGGKAGKGDWKTKKVTENALTFLPFSGGNYIPPAPLRPPPPPHSDLDRLCNCLACLSDTVPVSGLRP